MAEKRLDLGGGHGAGNGEGQLQLGQLLRLAALQLRFGFRLRLRRGRGRLDCLPQPVKKAARPRVSPAFIGGIAARKGLPGKGTERRFQRDGLRKHAPAAPAQLPAVKLLGELFVNPAHRDSLAAQAQKVANHG